MHIMLDPIPKLDLLTKNTGHVHHIYISQDIRFCITA